MRGSIVIVLESGACADATYDRPAPKQITLLQGFLRSERTGHTAPLDLQR